jgi:hypothetical protein
MEPVGSTQCSQEPATGPYPDTSSRPGVGNLFMLEGRINLAVIK